MKKRNIVTLLIFVAGLCLFHNDYTQIGAALVAWAYYRIGYDDGKKDGAREVFTK